MMFSADPPAHIRQVLVEVLVALVGGPSMLPTEWPLVNGIAHCEASRRLTVVFGLDLWHHAATSVPRHNV